jgi:hypothetical protein
MAIVRREGHPRQLCRRSFAASLFALRRQDRQLRAYLSSAPTSSTGLDLVCKTSLSFGTKVLPTAFLA